MNDRPPLTPDDLDHTILASEWAGLQEVAELLTRERPAPRAAFRGQLRSRQRELTRRGLARPRPSWLWPRVVVLLASGGALLGLVGVGLAGSGPFAP